ncbi:MAG: UvrB/UvrC motif-containing protein [Clostridium sp.]
MLCEKCKIREANVRYTEVVGNVKTEHYFCTQCAGEMDFGQYSAIFDGEFPFGKLLSGLLGLQSETSRPQKMQDVVCPTCHTTYEEFIENSRFGCADCYHVFDVLIGEKIKKLQESASHTGKQPKMQAKGKNDLDSFKAGTIELSAEEEIKQWEQKLRTALKAEEYDEAVICRDKLKALKEGVKNDDEMV